MNYSINISKEDEILAQQELNEVSEVSSEEFWNTICDASLENFLEAYAI